MSQEPVPRVLVDLITIGVIGLMITMGRGRGLRRNRRRRREERESGGRRMRIMTMMIIINIEIPGWIHEFPGLSDGPFGIG